MMPQTEGPALIAPCLVLPSGLETEVASDVQQTAGEVTARPAREESSSADADHDVQSLAPNSGSFLRRGGDEAILSEGNFLDGLEEFEKLPLREQRRKMKKTMTKVW